MFSLLFLPGNDIGSVANHMIHVRLVDHTYTCGLWLCAITGGFGSHSSSPICHKPFSPLHLPLEEEARMERAIYALCIPGGSGALWITDGVDEYQSAHGL